MPSGFTCCESGGNIIGRMLILVKDLLTLPPDLWMLTPFAADPNGLGAGSTLTLYGVELLVRLFGQPWPLCWRPSLGFLPPNNDIDHLSVPIRAALLFHTFCRWHRLAYDLVGFRLDPS